MGLPIIAAITVVVFTIVILKFQAAQARREKAIGLALAEIGAKAHLLHVRREQLTLPDFYGTRNFKNWEKEINQFVNARIIPIWNHAGFGDLTVELLPTVTREVETAACRPIDPALPQTFSNPEVYGPDMDPVHYEMYCAKQLQKAGWMTKTTPRSGDQGADVLAERGNLTLVVQCKLYSSNVGNGAVQEVVAARVFHRTNLAVVVSNMAFTRSARELANMSGVTLLHHSQLPAYTGEGGPIEVMEAS